MATSYSLSMKRGSARSVNLIKKTGNLLALRNIVPFFYTSFNVNCAVALERGVHVFMHVPLILLASVLCPLVKEALHF